MTQMCTKNSGTHFHFTRDIYAYKKKTKLMTLFLFSINILFLIFMIIFFMINSRKSSQIWIAILFFIGMMIYKIFWILTFEFKTRPPSIEYQPFLDTSNEDQEVMCLVQNQNAYAVIDWKKETVKDTEIDRTKNTTNYLNSQ